jgi:hypothetical protein
MEKRELTSIESSFGAILGLALLEQVEHGRFAGRRLGDLLFHEYVHARDRPFGMWVGTREWPVLVIQAAINAGEPETVAAILSEDARAWIDDDGGFDDPDDALAVLAWPSEWRRVFG